MKNVMKIGAFAIGCDLLVVAILFVAYGIGEVISFYTGIDCETVSWALQSLANDRWQIPLIVATFIAYDIYMIHTYYPMINKTKT